MKNLLLPKWLSTALIVVAIISGLNVIAFGYLTAKTAFGQPINPLTEAVEEVADVDLQLDQNAPPAVPTIVVGEPSPTPLPTNEPCEHFIDGY